MINKTTTVLTALLVSSRLIMAQVSAPLIKSYAGAAACSFSQHDVFSFTGNQASLGKLSQWGIGIYSERRFMLAELSAHSVAAALPAAHGGIGISLQLQGGINFQQSQAGLAYGRQLGQKLSVGTQFNYHRLSLGGYGAATAVSFEAAALFSISEKVQAGLQVNNPVGGKLNGGAGERLPSVYTLGLGYDILENVYLGAALCKEENKPGNMQVHLQYRMLPQLLVKAGCQTQPTVFSLGAGFIYKSFRLECTGLYHLQLGVTPGILLIFTGKNKKKV